MDEFEAQNEENIEMIRANRSHRQPGEKVVIARESQCLDLIQKNKNLLAKNAELARALQEQEMKNRFYHLAIPFWCLVCAGVAFLIGIVL